MNIIDKYMECVSGFWDTLMIEDVKKLSLTEALEVIKLTGENYVSQMKKINEANCVNVMLGEVDTKDYNKTNRPSNLFLVRDINTPGCDCKEDNVFYILVRSGFTKVDKNESVVLPAFESVFALKDIIKSVPIFPGVLIDTSNLDDYVAICPYCGNIGTFKYDRELGLLLQWNDNKKQRNMEFAESKHDAPILKSLPICIPRSDVIRGNLGKIDTIMEPNYNKDLTQYIVVLAIDGYNDDSKELYQIPEVVDFYKKIVDKYPYIFYYLNPDCWLSILMSVCGEVKETKSQNNNKEKQCRIEVDIEKLLFLIKANLNYYRIDDENEAVKHVKKIAATLGVNF